MEFLIEKIKQCISELDINNPNCFEAITELIDFYYNYCKDPSGTNYTVLYTLFTEPLISKCFTVSERTNDARTKKAVDDFLTQICSLGRKPETSEGQCEFLTEVILRFPDNDIRNRVGLRTLCNWVNAETEHKIAFEQSIKQISVQTLDQTWNPQRLLRFIQLISTLIARGIIPDPDCYFSCCALLSKLLEKRTSGELEGDDQKLLYELSLLKSTAELKGLRADEEGRLRRELEEEKRKREEAEKGREEERKRADEEKKKREEAERRRMTDRANMEEEMRKKEELLQEEREKMMESEKKLKEETRKREEAEREIRKLRKALFNLQPNSVSLPSSLPSPPPSTPLISSTQTPTPSPSTADKREAESGSSSDGAALTQKIYTISNGEGEDEKQKQTTHPQSAPATPLTSTLPPPGCEDESKEGADGDGCVGECLVVGGRGGDITPNSDDPPSAPNASPNTGQTSKLPPLDYSTPCEGKETKEEEAVQSVQKALDSYLDKVSLNPSALYDNRSGIFIPRVTLSISAFDTKLVPRDQEAVGKEYEEQSLMKAESSSDDDEDTFADTPPEHLDKPPPFLTQPPPSFEPQNVWEFNPNRSEGESEDDTDLSDCDYEYLTPPHTPSSLLEHPSPSEPATFPSLPSTDDGEFDLGRLSAQVADG